MLISFTWRTSCNEIRLSFHFQRTGTLVLSFSFAFAAFRLQYCSGTAAEVKAGHGTGSKPCAPLPLFYFFCTPRCIFVLLAEYGGGEGRKDASLFLLKFLFSFIAEAWGRAREGAGRCGSDGEEKGVAAALLSLRCLMRLLATVDIPLRKYDSFSYNPFSFFFFSLVSLVLLCWRIQQLSTRQTDCIVIYFEHHHSYHFSFFTSPLFWFLAFSFSVSFCRPIFVEVRFVLNDQER